MSGSLVVAGVAVVVGLGAALESLRCLADRLLISSFVYAVVAAGCAGLAGKLALDAI